MPRIDAQRIVRLFDGPAHLQRRLQRDGYSITLKAIERWVTRGRIPGDWLVILSIYANRDNLQFDLHEFVISDDDYPHTRHDDRGFLD